MPEIIKSDNLICSIETYLIHIFLSILIGFFLALIIPRILTGRSHSWKYVLLEALFGGSAHGFIIVSLTCWGVLH
jgi:hypothetical protein